MLKVPANKLPTQPLSWESPDEISGWVEYLIIEAEKQFPGISRGGERMDAVIEVVIQTVELPDMAATIPPGAAVIGRRGLARMVAQMVYSTIARNLPGHMRSPKS